MGVIFSIMAFSFLIIVHELGHLISAKMMGVTVERFSLGLGKPILKKHWKGTDYCLSPIPFGGYVKMKGDDSSLLEGEDLKLTEEEKKELESNRVAPDSYSNKPFLKKFFILVSGSSMNLLTALIIFFFLSMFYIEIPLMNATVGNVIKDSAAEAAGIKEGDTFLYYYDNEGIEHKIKTFNELNLAKEKGFHDFLISRNGEELKITMYPKEIIDYLSEQKVTIFGVEAETRTPTFSESIESTGFLYKSSVSSIFQGFGMLFNNTTGLPLNKVISGPIGIVNMTSKVADKATVQAISEPSAQDNDYLRDFFYIWALISVNLGLLNLFPLPPLDGGLVVVEALKPLIQRYKAIRLTIKYISFAGILLLMGLMVFATGSDLTNLFS